MTTRPSGRHDVVGFRCTICAMALWNPVIELRSSAVGLYDDRRFPGRCIVMFDRHVEHLNELPLDDLLASMVAVKAVATAIQAVTGSIRVNYAVLGNAEPHLHWHLIPRFPETEGKPHSSPWDDPRPRQRLDAPERDRLIAELRNHLEVGVSADANRIA